MKREDVISKHFNRAFMGYDMLEVDAFLDDVIRDIERLETALADAELRAKVLSDELEYKIKFEGYVRKNGDAETASAPEPENAPEAPAGAFDDELKDLVDSVVDEMDK